MPKFVWQGVTRSGEVRKGTIEAIDEAAVMNRLRADNITPRKVRKSAGDINITIGTGVKQKDIVVFTRQLGTMIDAGLPLVQCLDILSQQADNPAFRTVLAKVKNSVEQGASFSDALRRHPKVFDELYVNLVAAGEAGGILDTIMGRLSTYIEKAVKLKRQIKGAMVYPISIMCVAVLVIVVMLTKVIPVFAKVYKQFRGAKLPAATRFVISLSNGFIGHWYLFLAGFVGLVALFIFMRRNPKGRAVYDRVLLRLPIFGSLLRKSVVARFTRTLGTLLSSGVPILDALDICSKTAGNKTVEAALLRARAQISEGKELATPLGESRVFPAMVVQMIGVGEHTGAMDAMLQKIADFYEDEVDIAVAALTSLMEPLMMVVLGGLIGGLIVAMYMPIFNLAGNIK